MFTLRNFWAAIASVRVENEKQNYAVLLLPIALFSFPGIQHWFRNLEIEENGFVLGCGEYPSRGRLNVHSSLFRVSPDLFCGVDGEAHPESVVHYLSKVAYGSFLPYAFEV